MAMKMAVESMEMTPGAIPRPGRVPEQRLLSPELGFLVAAELRNSSWNMAWYFRVFASEAIYRRRGDVGGGSRGPHHVAARPGSHPCHQEVRAARFPTSSLLRTLCTCWKNRDFVFYFV